jgi:molybdopterin converting factor small subunit
MRIRVNLYSDVKRFAPGGKGQFDVTLLPGETLGHCLARLGIPAENMYTVLINGRRADLDFRFSDGDTLVIFPQICGG